MAAPSPPPGDQEEADIARAIAMSLEDVAASTSPIDLTKSNSDDDNNSSGIPGLDRKKMEEERLARLAGGTLTLRRPHPDTFDSSQVCDRESKRHKHMAKSPNGTMSENRNAGASTSNLQYPRGVIKRTWARGFARDNDIKIEEVLCKEDLKLAVLSSFQWNIDWLFRKLDARHSKVMLVMQANDDETRNSYREDSKDIPNLRICFPNMEGQISCMHSKLMLLSYSDHLRVVLPSANLVPYDWGETGVMENSVFMIDLPRLASAGKHDPDDLTFFGQQLFRFSQALGLGHLALQLLNFDFAQTEGMAFIHSIGGAHYGEDLRDTGHPGLCRAIRKLGLQAAPGLQLDYTSASLGSLNLDFLTDIYSAASGTEHGKTQAPLPKNAMKNFFSKGSQPKTSSSTHKVTPEDVEMHFRIYYPLRETVRSSLGGEDNAGTICLRKEHWDSGRFPRTIMRDHTPTRPGLLSHNKIILGRGIKATVSEAKSEAERLAWVYVGSHNLSESAWGKVVMDRSRKEPKINCRNWECGVLLRVNTDNQPHLPPGSMTEFDKTINLPCKIPGDEYGQREPWIFNDPTRF